MSIRVNVSDEVAASESRDVEPVPTGRYLVTISDCEIREVKEGVNIGQPYAALELTIVEPVAFEGRKMWTNIMLFGKAFSAVWLGKAMGWYDGSGTLDFPEPDELMGKQIVVKAVRMGETTDKKDPSKTYPPKNEVKGMFASKTWSTGAQTTGGAVAASPSGRSILP